jgi:ALG6, ALG8 glycosyltransferase family
LTRAGLLWTLRGASRPRPASSLCAVQSSYQTMRFTFLPRGSLHVSGILVAHGGHRYFLDGFFTRASDRQHWVQNAALLTLLFHPALLLIDFGHFQFNSVMLGPFLAHGLASNNTNDDRRFHTPRRHEFHFRKGSPGSLLLFSQLGIQADGLVLRTSRRLVPYRKVPVFRPKRRVRVCSPSPHNLSVSLATARSFLFASRL